MRTPALSILYVAYPLLTVSEDSAGGAEQMLVALEREMAAAGHRTTVAASEGSQVSGRLLATGEPVDTPDQYEEREREHAQCVLDYLRRHQGEFDLIHDESGSFFRHARECHLPVLATLHLPRAFYREEWFSDIPSNLYFNCVSESQAEALSDLPHLIGVVHNGIAVEQFFSTAQKDGYLLWLGRICEEKGPHLAIEVAKRAGLPLVLAGQVYPFSYHWQFCEREVRPHLAAGKVELIEGPSFAQKRALLRHARALLVTSTVAETSSLVAMEAMACGTPVVALRRGALPEIVADNRTGLLVDSLEEMAATIERAQNISPAACRARVAQYFTAARMGSEYERLYREMLTISEQRIAA